jgi:lactoylglutathione lyase
MVAASHVVATAQLTHIRLVVDDFPACYRFYRQVIGLRPGSGTPDGPYAEFESGGSVLALWDRGAARTDAVGDTGPGGVLLVFRVWDVDASCERMDDLGGRFEKLPEDRREWGLRVARLRDPAGNLVEINSRLRS